MNIEDGQTRRKKLKTSWSKRIWNSTPRISSSRGIESIRGFHWVLGAGHGAEQPGKRSPMWSNGTQLFEWQFNRHIVRLIAADLVRLGINHTVLVPEEMVGAFLQERVDRVKRIESNLPLIWVSVHGNAANNTSATGIETWYKRNDNDSRLIASKFQEDLVNNIGWIDRGIMQKSSREKEFYIFKHAPSDIPVILTENGFYTNFEQCQAMLQRNVQVAIAKSHVKSIVEINTNGISQVQPYFLDRKF